MITYVEGDLFQSPAKVLVNTVNTVGVMGKGIALEFKQRYPDMFNRYLVLCEKKQFDIGQLWIYKTTNKWVLNFPTKKHWRAKSRPEYIELGLQKFVQTYDQKGITSIAFPQLGCGNGELNWDDQVRPLMEKYLKRLPITIYIHLYSSQNFIPEHKETEAVHAWLQEEPQSLAFAEFWNDVERLVQSKTRFQVPHEKLEFDVELDNEQNGLIIRPQNREPVFIAKEENGFLDLWQYVRSTGYVVPDKLPMGLDEYGSLIISFLSKLDYMRTIRLFLPDSNKPQIGLQLVSKQKDKSASDSHADILTLAS